MQWRQYQEHATRRRSYGGTCVRHVANAGLLVVALTVTTTSKQYIRAQIATATTATSLCSNLPRYLLGPGRPAAGALSALLCRFLGVVCMCCAALYV